MTTKPAHIDVPDGMCPHCRTPVGSRDETFCCQGCEAAYHFIQGLGLDAFYRFRGAETAQPIASQATDSFEYFASDDYSEQHIRPHGDTLETTWYLSGMHCAACTWLIEKVCRAFDGILGVESRFADGRLLLRFQPGTRLQDLARQLSSLGYTAGLLPDAGSDSAGSELLRLGISGAIAANIMLMSLPFYTGLSSDVYSLWFGWIAGGLSIPLLMFGAKGFFVRAWRAARSGSLDLDQPIALGLASAFVLSWWHLIMGDMHQLYFDSMGMLVFFLLAGRAIRNAGVRKALAAGRRLLTRVPQMVTVLHQDRAERIPARRVVPGDRLRLRAGDVLPVDAVLASEHASLNLHVVSGESKPVAIHAGQAALAGAVNLGVDADFIARSSFQDAAFARLAQLSQDLYEGRNRAWRDRFAGWFMAGVVISAAAGIALWWSAGPFQAAVVAMTVFIVACPCALALAAPTARAFALKHAALQGIWIKNEGVFDRLPHVVEAIFDKTGVLTGGTPEISASEYLINEKHWLDGAISALQRRANHPIARAFSCLAGPSAVVGPVRDVASLPGAGLRGVVADRHLLLLAPPALARAEAWGLHQDAIAAMRQAVGRLSESQTRVCVFLDGKPAALFGLTDGVRPEAKAVADQLRRRGLQLSVLSGDGRGPVAAVAAQLGFDHVMAECLPEDKLAHIQQGDPHTKLLAGDGLNDMGALAAAGVSVTHSDATDAAVQFADVLFQDRDLNKLPILFQLTDTARTAMRRGLVLSLIYNTFAVGLTLAGLIGPLIAAILMPISSLSMIGVIAWTFRGRSASWASSHS